MKLFQTRHEWWEHELSAHRTIRKCILCKGLHQTTEALDAHLRSSHGYTDALERLDVARSCSELEANDAFQSCPLCEEWPTASSRRNSTELQKHLGRHLEQLALFALPHLEDDAEKSEHDESASEHDLESGDDDTIIAFRPGTTYLDYLKIYPGLDAMVQQDPEKLEEIYQHNPDEMIMIDYSTRTKRFGKPEPVMMPVTLMLARSYELRDQAAARTEHPLHVGQS